MGNDENIPPYRLLLPMCVECEFDGFFNVLRNIIYRCQQKGPFIDALKVGLTGATISIKAEDVGDWRQLKTESKQILQWKLLGFWANRNAPSFGKKLFEPSWEPPQRNSVEVVDGKSMSPDEIDTIITKKITLRVIELRLTGSTIAFCKYFVKVPNDVDVYNGINISKKTTSFDVNPAHLNRCFDALKSGKFGQINENVVENVFSQENAQMKARALTTLDPVRQKLGRPTLPTVEFSTSAGMQSAKRQRVDPNKSKARSDSHCDTSGTILVEIQKKIDNLSTWLDPSVVGPDGGSERLHVMIFKQKDEEIRQMKLTIDELRMEIVNLERDKSCLEDQVQTSSGLITALEKGVSATSELHTKSESELAASLSIINDQKQTIAQYQHTVEALEFEIRSSKDESAAKDREIGQLKESMQSTISEKSKIEEQYNELNGKVMQIEEEFKHQIQCLNTEAADKNGKFESKLKELEDIATAKDREIERLNQIIKSAASEKCALDERFNELSGKFSHLVPELQRQIDCLQVQLNEAVTKNGEFEKSLNEWKEIVTVKDREIVRMTVTTESNITEKRELEKKFNELSGRVSHLVPELQRRIECLQVKANETAMKNGESEANLSEWKDIATAKDREIERLNEIIKSNASEKCALDEQFNLLNGEFSHLVPQLQHQIDCLQEKLNEAVTKNGEFEANLIELKNIVSAKDREIGELTVTIESVTQVNETAEKNLQLESDLNEFNKIVAVDRETEKGKENLSVSGTVKLGTSADFEKRDFEELRENLTKLKFGWIKFHNTKNCKPAPGFLLPPDEHGVLYAQQVTSAGSLSLQKNLYFHYSENVPNSQKSSYHKAAVKRFNEIFNFNFK